MSDLHIRPATVEDVPAIVAMLADDMLGKSREDAADLTPYLAAFAVADADPHQHIVVAERDGRVVGTLQLTVIYGLSLKAATRGQVEGVRIHRDERGTGLGTTLMEWAATRAKELGCSLIQLSSNSARTDAHRFYERLGYSGSHIGYKMNL
ncbi:GNAT family N-acetyltransferase [Phytomonospora endophytica]|uniref:GNAT superfamily N-acetyltransferase n=1 Tax=Phytomonospora endophytica TaxID=714109 RepID=A0A841FWJ7_9ACTN|nr:GNAT family N-acetyltransferase [Phytomonospora endophytica]MBB6038108.1 GNAT superfamily N-acetyltransferase [Phytomonospora endophytica]GIG67429.1 GNAT family acetyltransferase [Phytomonospora endophytica]